MYVRDIYHSVEVCKRPTIVEIQMVKVLEPLFELSVLSRIVLIGNGGR